MLMICVISVSGHLLEESNNTTLMSLIELAKSKTKADDPPLGTIPSTSQGLRHCRDGWARNFTLDWKASLGE